MAAASVEEQQAYAQAVRSQLIATVACQYYMLNGTEAQMRYSEANYLQVIEARQQLLSVQLELVGERYTSAEVLTTLFRSLGGGSKE